ncbi:MAG: Slp family lipoprotein, partial [Nitrospirales bacterium]
DTGLTFSTLKDAPDSYRGLLVVYSGEVLTATLTHEGTRLEVLQLPRTDEGEPTADRTRSQGRFLALHKEFLDPATIPAGTRVTVVGEVVGATTKPLDETEYTYPTLEVKHLKIWPESRTLRYGYYPFYPYYWGPFYGRFGRYYPYWW